MTNKHKYFHLLKTRVSYLSRLQAKERTDKIYVVIADDKERARSDLGLPATVPIFIARTIYFVVGFKLA